MSQSELLIKVIAALDDAGVPYMVTGSFVSSLQGEPRLTHDVDVVVAISPDAVKMLARHFPSPDYYFDEIAAAAAIQQVGQFNLMDESTGDKVDFWLLTNEAFDQSRFARRRLEDFEGQLIYVSQPEDTILMKLHWAEMSGGSTKQLADVRSVYTLQRTNLDRDYIEHWAKLLNVVDLWQRIKNPSPSHP